MIVQYEISTGRITQWIETADEYLIHYKSDLLGAYIVSNSEEKIEGWVAGGFIFPVPPKPSEYHEFNWATKEWQETQLSLESALYDAKLKLLTHYNSLRYSAISLDGSLFDADTKARPNIQGVLFRLIRGEGLTNGWLGWRDFNNQMHWANETPDFVQVKLSELSHLIENRDQDLIIKHWVKKSEIEALQTVPEVMNYAETQITSGWF